MPTKILDADAHITSFYAEFVKRLDSVSWGSFPEDNPKKSVCHLCARLKPLILKKEMRRRIDYDESIEKYVKIFIKLLIQEAKSCQAYGANTANSWSDSISHKTRRQSKDRTKHEAKSTKDGIAKKKNLCSYPFHKEKGFFQYLKDCKVCPKDEKYKLFDELSFKIRISIISLQLKPSFWEISTTTVNIRRTQIQVTLWNQMPLFGGPSTWVQWRHKI